jgi:hypothetical protein
MSIPWEQETAKKFNDLLERIPIFLRPVAQGKVSKKAASLALTAQRTEIIEKDLVEAFFIETPFGFHGPMKSDMEALGIDYKKYGQQ